ncbi:MAG: glutathione S-transferase family protein [Gammaproteobacteria bacterium]|jgi:glutathione S-transferase|nr:glutathione S-transferase family protein [Gammaproteobacteria bacterium]
MLKLYHHYMSICAAKVRIALAEKRLEWEGQLLDLSAGDQFKPDYLSLNPKAVVPTLVHDDHILTESNIIIEYLDDAFSDPILRPGSAHERAQMRLLLMRLDNGSESIHHDMSVVTYGSAYRLHLLERVIGHNRKDIDKEIDRSMNAYSKKWLQETVHEGVEAQSFKKGIRSINKLLDDFESMLGQSRWLAGSEYSLADLAYTSYMARLEMLGFEGMWRQRSRVFDWYERLKQRPSFQMGVLDWLNPKAVEILTSGGQESWPKVERILKH